MNWAGIPSEDLKLIVVVIMKANIILIGVFCVFCSSVSHAEYDASDLGKLFTDKSQRSQIDAARSGGSSSAEPKQAEKVGITVDGTHVHLKPGETWSKETGKTVDNY